MKKSDFIQSLLFLFVAFVGLVWGLVSALLS